MKQNNIAVMKIFQQTVVAVAAAIGATCALADGAIQSVTGDMQGGSEVVRIHLSEPLQELPAGFAIQSPARIALDFPGTANEMGRSLVDFNQGNLKSVNVVQAGERSRVVESTSSSPWARARRLSVVPGSRRQSAPRRRMCSGRRVRSNPVPRSRVWV